MQTQKNYKNAGIRIIVPNNSAEPLNAMSSGNTELSSSCSLEGCSTKKLDKVVINRVPVISKSGKPLMPCKPAKARKLLESGLAVRKWSKKLGIFYIHLTFDPKSELNKKQKVIFSGDPGSKYDGYAVTTKVVNITGMSELPSGIVKKLETRRTMRRARRFRNTRQIPERVDNRNREGFIAPSQKAKVEFRLTIIKELCELYPVTDFSVEDVAFNHYEKRWGKHFSTVELGKDMLYSELRKIGELHTFKGHETKKERERLGLKKNDVVIFEGELARTGGFMDDKISLHSYDLDNKRFTQSASPTGCHRLFNQKIMFEVEHGSRYVNPASTNARGQIPPAAKASGFPLTP